MGKELVMHSAFALDIHHLTVCYGNHVGIKELSLQVPSGLLIGIVGPNGAGKSTLVKAICGMEKPLSGTIRFFGHSFSHYRKKIAYIPQKSAVELDFPITAIEVVLMGVYPKLGLFKRPSLQDRQRALELLDDVGMKALADRRINELSGGQQQRVFIARALMQEAEIFFFDEPFTGIDAVSERQILHLLQELKKKNKTLFVIHHDMQTWKRYFDWLILLNQTLIAYGPTDQVMTPHQLNKAYGSLEREADPHSF